MEEGGAQMMVIHHQKRDLPSFHHHHPSWNPNSWDWDPLRFLATPAPSHDHHPPLPPKPRRDDDDDSSTAVLRLDLAGALADARPSKRVRSNSPASYPMCQVDNCREDLSGAKDYHRRHKVCEVHSKSTRALVGSHPQRFCQQCSRFHLLSEFDEGKRSCRRRLAGHNRRRRKTQPDDPASKLVLPAERDVLNLLAAVAGAQGKSEGWPSPPDKEQVIQILSKINSLPLPADLAAKLRNWIPENPGKPRSESTIDLLSNSGENNNNNTNNNKHHRGDGSSSSYQSPTVVEDPECQLHLNLPLPLFSSSPENESRPPQTQPQQPPISCGRNYFSSDSSVSPPSTSSPPVVQKLFPMQTMAESVKSEKISPPPPRPLASRIPFDLFSNGKPSDAVSVQLGYTSSGSDHSPPSLNSEVQDRTGRILFKLFDKDPSHFPGTLRNQIFNWLSNSPSEMESYIRPGCVVLSVYLSMPTSAWEQLQENLLQHLTALAQGSASDFWRNGRFLVQTGRKLASHKDGKFRLCKSWRSWSSPELTSVSPLAVVGGQETSLVLRGRNLSNTGTKIHCTFMGGGYTTKEVRESTCRGSSYEEINLCGFKLHDSSPSILGRCFIEVENGFKGNSFPIIVADATICKELSIFESVFNGEGKVSDVVTEDQSHEDERPRSKEEVLHFLNELGWLFQRKNASSFPEVPYYSVGRFKFLLTFSAERNCCYLINTLLDILAERTSDSMEQSKEALGMLSEIQLLHRAVKRRSKAMVDLLINYSVVNSSDGSKIYIFPPNHAGPGGITPLHLAASISGSDDVIDALTNDQQQIGLSSWNSLMDANGQSPYAYASMTNNESYNKLVARKIADTVNGQVTVTIPRSEFVRERKSCAKCLVTARRYQKRVPGAQGLLQRPYIHSMLAIAAVCVCVCLFLRGLPDIGAVAPFKWENLDYGTI